MKEMEDLKHDIMVEPDAQTSTLDDREGEEETQRTLEEESQKTGEEEPEQKVQTKALKRKEWEQDKQQKTQQKVHKQVVKTVKHEQEQEQNVQEVQEVQEVQDVQEVQEVQEASVRMVERESQQVVKQDHNKDAARTLGTEKQFPSNITYSYRKSDGKTTCNFTVFPSDRASVTSVLSGKNDVTDFLGGFIDSSSGENITIFTFMFPTRYQGSILVNVDLGIPDTEGDKGLMINCENDIAQLHEIDAWAALDCKRSPADITVPTTIGTFACPGSVPQNSHFGPVYDSKLANDARVLDITLMGAQYIMFRAQWTGYSASCPAPPAPSTTHLISPLSANAR